MLGYDHYAGNLQKIRNYITASIRHDNQRLESIIKSDRRDPESLENPISWVDLFLTRNVHILGFGLDFSELDIWWLLDI